MHVFADLQPYICTFPNCDHELAQFSTRAAWADHEFKRHRFEERWSCPECGIEENSPQDWERHVNEDHALSLTGPELTIAKEVAWRTKDRPVDKEECLLCRDTPAQSRRAFIKHVGRHMEEMALLALPRDTEDDSDHSSDSTDLESEAETFILPEDFAKSRSLSFDEEGRERTRCPHPDCRRPFKDLKAHLLTHQLERPEKCPFATCAYHVKGFSRKYDKNRHTLTHYKGTMVCGFCPGSGSGSAAEKSFNRADVFKRHLASVHGAEQNPTNGRKKSPVTSNGKGSASTQDVSGRCSTCLAMFKNAQELYDHLDDCVIHALQRSVTQQDDASKAFNEQNLRSVVVDENVREILDHHTPSTPKIDIPASPSLNTLKEDENFIPLEKPLPSVKEEHTARKRGPSLNEFFISSEGINREVLQKEICRFLGPEATSRPFLYEGVHGYKIKAVRPFTPPMLDDLISLSKAYVSEMNETKKRRGRKLRYSESDDSRHRGYSRRIGKHMDTIDSNEDYENDYVGFRTRDSRGISDPYGTPDLRDDQAPMPSPVELPPSYFPNPARVDYRSSTAR